LYCPTRRSVVRSGVDNQLLLNPAWQAGGTDYGGCAGRHTCFAADANFTMQLATAAAGNPVAITFVPGATLGVDITYQVAGDTGVTAGSVAGTATPDHGYGIFGQVNMSTGFGQIKDGTSNTIMTGELQKITVVGLPVNASTGPQLSHDGWVIGGSSTLFTTGYRCDGSTSPPATAPLSNNGWFGSPGSDHSGGANYGMGDGSVRYMSSSVNGNIFCLLGSMADKIPAMPPE
jgi:prepilin-type processing-associated H-X9-DG protein